MHRASSAAVHELLVVVEVEGVEVDALPAFHLLDAEDFSRMEFDRLPRARLEDHFAQHGPHLCAAAYSRNASFTSAARSAATPFVIVRSMSSSCCWLSFSVILRPGIAASNLGYQNCIHD